MSNSGKLNSLMAQKATLENKQLNAEDIAEKAMISTQLSSINGRITSVRQQQSQDKIEAQNEKRAAETQKQSEINKKEESKLKAEEKKETKTKKAKKKEETSDLKFIPKPDQPINASANTAFNKNLKNLKLDQDKDS